MIVSSRGLATGVSQVHAEQTKKQFRPHETLQFNVVHNAPEMQLNINILFNKLSGFLDFYTSTTIAITTTRSC